MLLVIIVGIRGIGSTVDRRNSAHMALEHLPYGVASILGPMNRLDGWRENATPSRSSFRLREKWCWRQ